MKVITRHHHPGGTAAVLRELLDGQTLVIARDGTPVAEIRPLPSPSRRFVQRAVIADAALRAPPLNYAKFFADLDAVVDSSVSASA